MSIDGPLSNGLYPININSKVSKGCFQSRDLEGELNVNPWRPKLFFSHSHAYSSCVLGYEGWEIIKQNLCGVNVSIFCHNPNPHSAQRWPIIYQWQSHSEAQWICDIVNNTQPTPMQAFDFSPSKVNFATYDIHRANEHPTLVVQWGHPNSVLGRTPFPHMLQIGIWVKLD